MPTLHELADSLHSLAPWRWMREDQLFGIRLPSLDEIAWISVMGAAGNHESVAVYLGDEALHRFNLINAASVDSPVFDRDLGMKLSDEDTVAVILEARQLQVNFTDRDDLYPAERREIKALGRKYRGRSWPCFRSYRAGCVPAMADGTEREWLALAIGQVLAVAPVFAGGLPDQRIGRGQRLVRERDAAPDGADRWRDTCVPEDLTAYRFPEPKPSAAAVAALLACPPSRLVVECRFQLLPQPVGSPGKGGVFPYLAMSVDADGGFVLGVEVFSVEKGGWDGMIAAVPDAFLRSWERHGIRPAEVRVSDEYTRSVLKTAARSLGTPLTRHSKLPALNRAMRSMMRSMGM